MSIQYDPQTLIEGNRLRQQASERPSTFAEYNGAVDVIPSGGLQLRNQTRFAGQRGVRAIELMNNPQAAMQTQEWMNMFGQSVPGFQFNQAKMMMAQPAQPAPKEGDK